MCPGGRRAVRAARRRDASARRALRSAGALELGARYWNEVEARPIASSRVRRARRRDRPAAAGELGRCCASEARDTVDEAGARSRFPIIGGVLARTPAGSISFSQTASRPSSCARRSTASSLAWAADRAGRPGRARSTGTSSRRIHTSISRRYFRRLIGEEPTMKVVVFGATGHDRARAPARARARPRGRRGLAQRAAGRGRASRGRSADATDARVGARGARRAPTSPTTSSTRWARPTSSARDRAAAETVAREARRPGSAQIVYLGGLGDDSPDLSPHLRSRIETGRALASGSVPVTTLRAAMVVGAGSAAFETILALVDRLPAMICPRWVSTPTQPIALDDVVALPRGGLRPRGRSSARASTSAAPRS